MVKAGQEPAEAMVTRPRTGAMKEAPGDFATIMHPVQISETLEEILSDVESLAQHKTSGNEDFPCHVNGSWISEAGGVRLNIEFKDIRNLDVVVDEDVGKSAKVNPNGFLMNGTWSFSGLIPLEKKSMVVLTGVNEKENQVATFIGEYKCYSRRIQTMWGHWIYGAASDTNLEGIFSQRIFFDGLEKIGKIRTHIDITIPLTNTPETSTILIPTTSEFATSISTNIERSSETVPITGMPIDDKAVSTTEKFPKVVMNKLNVVQKDLEDILNVLNDYWSEELKSRRFATKAFPSTTTTKETTTYVKQVKNNHKEELKAFMRVQELLTLLTSNLQKNMDTLN